MIPLSCRESAGQRLLPNVDKIERGVCFTRRLDDRPVAVNRLLLNDHVYCTFSLSFVMGRNRTVWVIRSRSTAQRVTRSLRHKGSDLATFIETRAHAVTYRRCLRLSCFDQTGAGLLVIMACTEGGLDVPR
jgi:hypothetical protein